MKTKLLHSLTAPETELVCRIYPVPSGMAGVPTVDRVLEALRNRGL